MRLLPAGLYVKDEIIQQPGLRSCTNRYEPI